MPNCCREDSAATFYLQHCFDVFEVSHVRGTLKVHLYNQHTTHKKIEPPILIDSAFCRNQGAILSSVIPEALLDYRDYIQWASKLGNIYTCPKDEEQFNVMSDEAWTCVLMQVIKVCVIHALMYVSSLILHIIDVHGQKD